MKKFLQALSFVMMLFVMTSCSSKNTNSDNSNKASSTNKENLAQENEKEGYLTISAAASLTDALNDVIIEFFNEYPEISINANFASSGAIQTQIEEGAPVDIFLSASTKQIDSLKEQDLLDNDSIYNLLENEVVLVTPKDSDLQIESFEDLANSSDIDKGEIAIGEVGSVPVGEYTKEIYENLGLWDKIEPNANWAKDVREVLDWVTQGEVKAGIVYKTDAILEKDNLNIIASAPEGSHNKVIYPMAIVKKSDNKDNARLFEEFLKKDQAKKIFNSYGFKVK
ncbi:MAG: molybdate ABC transporter substrate-binding protein [Tissierellia bacterium]|nr:molybdate ABC transporter substrate-binding protein [Tissierellia bacterium]